MAEVEGRLPAKKDDGHAFSTYCNTCPGVKGTAFCVDCHEYLCSDCTGYHQRLKLTKTHTLLTGEEFPSVSPPKRQDDKTMSIRKCPNHPNEKIKFYCEGHKTLCCVACNVLGHEQCTKAYIPDIAEDFKNGPEFQNLRTEMQDSDQLIADSLTEINTCLNVVGTLKAGEIEILKKYRTKIIKYLDRREKELQAEIQQIHDQDVALLHELQTQLKTRQSELMEMRTKLKSHKKNTSELYIAAKGVCSQLAQLQSSLQETAEKIGYRQYAISRDTRMEKMLENRAGFASVVHAGDELILGKLRKHT